MAVKQLLLLDVSTVTSWCTNYLTILVIMTTPACLLCRFNLEELRQACGDVADVEMKTLQSSADRLVDSLAKTDHNSDQVNDTEYTNEEDEDVISDEELEELHEFMLTQRQKSSETREPQIDAVDDNLPSNKEDDSETEKEIESESEDEDVVHLSQALLRKLEETFAAEHTQDEDRSSSAAEMEDSSTEICDKLSVHSSDQVMSAELGRDDMEVNVVDDVEDDGIDNQQISESLQQDSEICSEPKHLQVPTSVNSLGHLTLVEPPEKDAEMDDVNSPFREQSKSISYAKVNSGSVTAPLPLIDVHEVEMLSDDTVEDKPASPGVATEAAESAFCSTASPVNLFDESSLDQCDLERLNASADESASADDKRHLLDVDFIDVNELIDQCESSDDLFDSPKSTTFPAADPSEQSETLSHQGAHARQYSPVESLQRRLDDPVHHDCQTPLSSRKSTSSPVQNLQTQFKGIPASPHKSLLSPQENPDTRSEILTKEDMRSQSPTVVAEVEGVDIIEVAEHLPDKQKSSISVTTVDLTAEHQPTDSGGITSKRGSLRKVRAKTRNSLSADDVCFSEYPSTFPRTLRSRDNRGSRPAEADVEPDSDEDDVPLCVRSEKSRVSRRLSPRLESTKKCYVKLTRIKDADLPPQVELIKL